MHSLPVFLRLTGRPEILLADGESAEAKRRLLERAGAEIVGEGADAALAIVALDDPEQTVARLKARGILVNAVDRPDLCDFTLPAIMDRDPVLVAIGTGGASAGLAKALRLRIEALLPASLGALARGSECGSFGRTPVTGGGRSMSRWRKAGRSIRSPGAATLPPGWNGRISR